MNKNIWRDDISKEELKQRSTNFACLGLLFMLLITLIISCPKLAITVCIALAFVSIILSILLGIKAKK